MTVSKTPESGLRRSLVKALLQGSSLCALGLSPVQAARETPQSLAGPAGLLGQQGSTGKQAQRLALLVGNWDYPTPHELPPVRKNIQDLAQALSRWGFEVAQALNLDEQNLSKAAHVFVQRVTQAPAGSVNLFYYAGHGLQMDSSNLLLGSGSNPAAPGRELVDRSLPLQQRLLAALPQRQSALNIAVIDACRTDLNSRLGDQEGMNQLEAPLGSLVCFSTAAGRPALSPARSDQNTFYTASLVRLLNELPPHTLFTDLFQLVKQDVEHTMSTHPLPAIRRLAQRPFIADNSRLRISLGMNPNLDNPLHPGLLSNAELVAWQAIQASTWPAELHARCRAFLQEFPGSIQAQVVGLYLEGAVLAQQALRNPEVRLFRTSFVLPALSSPAEAAEGQADLHQAARADKDAAARIARRYLGTETDPQQPRYVGWLQYAGALGNGIASYELALHYRAMAQPLLAAQAEARARQLGYSPPRSLGHVRK